MKKNADSSQMYRVKSSDAFFFLQDGLSTVRDVIGYNSSTMEWEVRASYEFSEYGEKISLPNPNAIESSKTYVGGLSVQDEVADTGLMLMGHRFYEPSLGRFLNRDPIGFTGGLNLYSYGANNPTTLTDHTGLRPLTARESATLRTAIAYAAKYDSGVSSGSIGRIRNLFISGQIVADNIPQIALHSDLPGFAEEVTIGIDSLRRIETLENILAKRKEQGSPCDTIQDDLESALIRLASALIHEGTHANGFNRFGQTAADEAAAYTAEALFLRNAIMANSGRERLQRNLRSTLNDTFNDALGQEGIAIPESLRPR